GCNMAFRREALEGINGFDPQYRKAGDDVDICWRLQQAGYWITFAPGGFVWHHRRQNPRSYLKQQAGYGEAEALLRFKHPDKFNGRGHGKWRGVLYGISLQGLRFGSDIIYRGTFASGFFQCLYQAGPAHWAMLPSTLEWHVGIGLIALAAGFWPPAWLAVAGLLALSVTVAALQAARVRLAPADAGLSGRLLIAALCYVQPLVRSWTRYRTRLLAYRLPRADLERVKSPSARLPWTGRRTSAYWTEEGRQRTELLDRAVAYLTANGWGKTIDSGWRGWDLEIYCHPWTVVQVCTAQEDHGGGKHLIRVRYRLRLSAWTRLIGSLVVVAAAATLALRAWPAAAGTVLLSSIWVGAWWRGTYRAGAATAVLDRIGEEMGLVR